MITSLEAVMAFLKQSLLLHPVPDVAINGLQVENSGKIKKIATAVDTSLMLLNKVIKDNCDAILVHHGIFWKNPFPITGRYYQILKKLIENDIALIAFHLPLDVHPVYGNNRMLVKRLGLKFLKTFGDYKGIEILIAALNETKEGLQSFLNRFSKMIGEPICVVEGGKHQVEKIGICSGGGIFGIEKAKEIGCDTYITGDADHNAFHLCKEIGIHLISGGHYNTEIWGVKELGKILKKNFSVQVNFYDLPTGI